MCIIIISWRRFAPREEEMEEVKRSRSREYLYDEERENLTERPSNEAELPQKEDSDGRNDA
jgi:hypothetical protein